MINILSKLHFWYLKQKYKKNKKIYLRKKVKFNKTRFEGCGKFGDYSNISSSSIGYGTYIGKNCELSFSKIGKFCSIGDNVKIILGNHPIYDYVSSHPIFHNDALKKQGLYFKDSIKKDTSKYIKDKDNNRYSVIIEDDVWIGTNVSILGGIKIGNGAVIGTGAIVTKDIDPYSIVIGVPAKKIKSRFTEEEIRILEDFKWWNKDIKWLEKNVKKFSDIKFFVEEIKNKNI